MNMDIQTYEARQLAELRGWLGRPPNLIARGFGRTTSPLVRAMKPWTPQALMESSFARANQAAEKLAWRQQLLLSAGLSEIDELQDCELATCDDLWRGQRRRMMLLAGGEGALTGLGGAAGWVLDVPALLILALEGIHRTGLSYGYEWDDASTPLAIFSLAAANNMEEKQLAWQGAMSSQISSAEMLEGLERTLNQSFAKRAVSLGMAQVARQMGVNLGRRKALGMVPLAGALVGGSVNAWYLRDVMQASRYVCHALRFVNADLSESLPDPE